MRVYKNKKRVPRVESVSIGSVEAELTPEIVASCNMKGALERFAQRLLRERIAGGRHRELVGVKIVALDIQWITADPRQFEKHKFESKGYRETCDICTLKHGSTLHD